MSVKFRSSGLFVRVALLSATFFGLAESVVAQTNPTLIPYTLKLVAGGGSTTPAKGGTCPVSGFTATDAYGDGCLATEVLLGTSASAPPRRRL